MTGRSAISIVGLLSMHIDNLVERVAFPVFCARRATCSAIYPIPQHVGAAYVCRNFIFVEVIVPECCLNVHFLLDISVQKSVVVVKYPALQVAFCRYRQHYADAFKSANRNERSTAVATGY